MKHAGVERPAKVPVSAVPHWEGSGWEKTDPPPRPQPTKPTTEQLDAPKLPSSEDSAESPVDSRASAKNKTPKAAPAGRKED